MLTYLHTLKMEAVCSSEMVENLHQATWCHTFKTVFHSSRSKNLKIPRTNTLGHALKCMLRGKRRRYFVPKHNSLRDEDRHTLNVSQTQVCGRLQHRTVPTDRQTGKGTGVTSPSEHDSEEIATFDPSCQESSTSKNYFIV
jgi:hypothetical protein